MAKLFIDPEDPSIFPRFYNQSLIDNYGEARGVNVVNVSRPSIKFDVENFVKERMNSVTLVHDILNGRVINYRDCDTIEAVENREFIVSKDKDCDTTIVTPDVNIYEDIRRDRVILKRLKIYNGIPYLVDKNKKMKEVNYQLFKTIMIMNPYVTSMKYFERLVNNPNFNVIIGTCGKTYDRDYGRKIDQMSNLYERTNVIRIL